MEAALDEERYDVEGIEVHSDMDEEEMAELENLVAEAESAEQADQSGDPAAAAGQADFRMNGRGPPPGLRPSANGKASNTGPKGVKADYEEAKRNLINTQRRERMRAQRAVRDRVHGKVEFQQRAPEVPTDKEVRAARRRAAGEDLDDGRGGDSDSDSSELSGLSDEEDGDTFRQYMAQRLQYFHDSLPQFGTFERVDVAGIAASLRGVNESTVTLIHLYENDLETCTAVNLAFEDLAPQFKHVQFLRCRALEAMPNFKMAGLPALMVYKGTEQTDTLLRFIQPLGRNFSDADLVALLEEKKLLALPMPTVGQLSKGYAG